MSDLLPDTLTDLAAQIAEVKRELKQRERTYPRLISQRLLTDERAERQTTALRAVLGTLQRLAERAPAAPRRPTPEAAG